MKQPICLFDSGIGGLTVLKKLIGKFPNENYIYLADLINVPFGDKTKEEIEDIAKGIIEWLSRFNPKFIVMACNTSSTILSSKLSTLPPQRGEARSAGQSGNSQFDIPIFGMIDSCAKETAGSNYKKVSVWATKLVIENSGYTKAINKLNPDIQVEEIACPKLVPMIESVGFNGLDKQSIIKEYLDEISNDSESLILGCTHYPIIENDLIKLTNLKLIDPADSLTSELESYLTKDGKIANESKISIYTTAQLEKIEKFARIYLCTNVCVRLVDLQKTKV